MEKYWQNEVKISGKVGFNKAKISEFKMCEKL
jgi:hypothetical protein